MLADWNWYNVAFWLAGTGTLGLAGMFQWGLLSGWLKLVHWAELLAGTGPLGLASWLELVHLGFLAGSNWSTGACWLAGAGPLGLSGWLELVHWGLLAGWNWYTGTLVHWYTGTLVHWYTCTLVHWYTGAFWLAGTG